MDEDIYRYDFLNFLKEGIVSINECLSEQKYYAASFLLGVMFRSIENEMTKIEEECEKGVNK